MDGKIAAGRWPALALTLTALALGVLLSAPARAAVVELSATGAYSKAKFDDYDTTQRRYTGSIDFKFTSVSALQFEYTDSQTKANSLVDAGIIDPNYITKAETYRDKIYSFNWVQNLVPSSWILQPYFVVGGGKIRRYRSIEYPALKLKYEARQSETTGVGGVGVRLFFLKNLALKGELKTYVPKFRYSQWRDNQMMSVGFSWLF